MKAIKADPCSISTLFEKRQYEIPPFQRPYTWTEPICAKLWEDLIDFYDKWKGQPKNDRERYFLGSLILYPRQGWERDLDSDIEEAYCVVDGQQRLTTLSLLVAALHCLAKDNYSLQAVLHVKKNDKITSELRVLTNVLEDDRMALDKIIGDMFPETLDTESVGKKKASRQNNFVLFRNKISEWFAETGKDVQQLNDFINMLLRWVVILPIECGSQEDAFNIFEVVNNRGKPLTDADIFKSNILQNLTCGNPQTLNANQREFLKKWERWCREEEEAFGFRALMRILKAKDGISDSTDESIVTYFQNTKKTYFRDAGNLIEDLEKIFLITQWQRPPLINGLWLVMSKFPNESWKWPVYIYLFKYGKVENDAFALEEQYEPSFISLCRRVIRFMYGRGIIGKGSQTNLKPTTYKDCARIFKRNYDEITDVFALTESDIGEIRQKLDKYIEEPCYQSGNRFGPGLVFLASMLLYADEKSSEAFSNFINGGCIDIEHICPKNWSNADGWDEETHTRLVNTIGNLMPLEKAINIQVSNDSFLKKKTGMSLSKRGGIRSYQDSCSPEARAMSAVKRERWLPADVEKRSRIKIKALRGFFA